MTTGQRAALTVLLGAGIPIVEHLTGLDGAAATGAIFTAVSGRTRIDHLPGSRRRTHLIGWVHRGRDSYLLGIAELVRSGEQLRGDRGHVWTGSVPNW